MARVIYKEYYRCATQSDLIAGLFGEEVKLVTQSITFNGRYLPESGTYVTEPFWFFQVNGFPLGDITWGMYPPAEDSGEYWFSWSAVNVGTGSTTEYIVKLIMLDYCNVPVGCDTPTAIKPLSVLAWITREGGIQYFPFNGKKSFEVTIPDGQTYVNSEFVLRNTSRKGVYSGETLTTGPVPELALDALQSLKESIQVYYLEDFLGPYTEYQYVPIILQDGNFNKRRTDEKRWDVTVKFLYATERQIQTQ